MIRVFAAFALLSAITSCVSADRLLPSEQAYCEAFENWIDAGPRTTYAARDIVIFRPVRDVDSKTVVLTSLGVWADCGYSMCSDRADEAFVRAAFGLAHYIWIDDYMELSARCLGIHALDIDTSEDTPPVELMVERANTNLSIAWKSQGCPVGADAFEGCTVLTVSY